MDELFLKEESRKLCNEYKLKNALVSQDPKREGVYYISFEKNNGDTKELAISSYRLAIATVKTSFLRNEFNRFIYPWVVERS